MISEKGNSGIFFRTDNVRDPVQTGIEIQILNSHGREALSNRGSMGAVYNCLAPSKNAMKPAGEWNHITPECRDNRILVVLNYEQVIDMDLDRWTEPHTNPDGTPNKFRTAFKDMPREGHIGFQDYFHPVWFRQIRIKPLD